MTESDPCAAFLCHPVRLSRAEVLEALRQAALARARDVLRCAEPSAQGVELETRFLPDGGVAIEGAVVTVRSPVPEALLAVLYNAAARPMPALEEPEPAEEAA